MPNLRCPSCYYSTSFRKDAITENIQCSYCEFNLHAYYYAGRDEKISKDFIDSENQRLKKIKSSKDRSANAAHNTAMKRIDAEYDEYEAEYAKKNAEFEAEMAEIDAEYEAAMAEIDAINGNRNYFKTTLRLLPPITFLSIASTIILFLLLPIFTPSGNIYWKKMVVLNDTYFSFPLTYTVSAVLFFAVHLCFTNSSRYFEFWDLFNFKEILNSLVVVCVFFALMLIIAEDNRSMQEILASSIGVYLHGVVYFVPLVVIWVIYKISEKFFNWLSS